MACNLEQALSLEALGQRVFRKSAKGDATSETEVHIPVAMLPLLPDARMKELLRDALVEQGWSGDPPSREVKLNAEMTATATLEDGIVKLIVRSTREVSADGSAIEKKENESEGDAAAEENARKNLETAKAEVQARLEREALKVLGGVEKEIRAEVSTALQKVYRVALEEKARSMGHVESINEKKEDGDYTVTVTLVTT